VVSRWRAGFYGASRFIVRVFLSVFFRPRAYGQGNVPEHGGALLLSNHQSYLDPVLIGAFSPRRLLYMARLTLFTNPVFGGLIRLLGVFPVKRGRPDRGSIRLAIRHLQSGEIVVMFPEGTRTPDGELQRVKGGFKLLVRWRWMGLTGCGQGGGRCRDPGGFGSCTGRSSRRRNSTG